MEADFSYKNTRDHHPEGHESHFMIAILNLAVFQVGIRWYVQTTTPLTTGLLARREVGAGGCTFSAVRRHRLPSLVATIASSRKYPVTGRGGS
jgi:hypothetical protein